MNYGFQGFGMAIPLLAGLQPFDTLIDLCNADPVLAVL